MWVSTVIYSISAGLLTLVGILTLSRLSIFEGPARWADEHMLAWLLFSMFSAGAATACGIFLVDKNRLLAFLPLVVTLSVLGSIGKRMKSRIR